MYRIAATICLTASMFTASARPAPSPVSAAFGNTIVSTYPDSRTAELWLAPDGSYTASGRRGDPSNGRWAVRKDKLCLKQAHPLPMPFSFCAQIPQTGLGTPWSSKAVTGEPIRVRVVRGHFAGKPRAA
jgi:hypothetical protein